MPAMTSSTASACAAACPLRPSRQARNSATIHDARVDMVAQCRASVAARWSAPYSRMDARDPADRPAATPDAGDGTGGQTTITCASSRSSAARRSAAVQSSTTSRARDRAPTGANASTGAADSRRRVRPVARKGRRPRAPAGGRGTEAPTTTAGSPVERTLGQRRSTGRRDRAVSPAQARSLVVSTVKELGTARARPERSRQRVKERAVGRTPQRRFAQVGRGGRGCAVAPRSASRTPATRSPAGADPRARDSLSLQRRHLARARPKPMPRVRTPSTTRVQRSGPRCG